MRRANDAYYTGDDAVKALMRRILVAGRVYEPCAGNGAISKILREYDLDVIENDIIGGHDATTTAAWKDVEASWVITNPPFNQAFDILVEALSRRFKVAFLLRLSFLEPTYQRGSWLATNPPTKLIILPRFSFTGDGKTDSVTCAWMIWNYKDNNPIEIVAK